MKKQKKEFLYENHKLVSWRQRRCEVCGRFLSKKQYRFCAKHGSGRERQSRYEKTPKGKTVRKRYQQSPKGRACSKRGDSYKKKEANFLTEENLEEEGIPSSVIQDEEDEEV